MFKIGKLDNVQNEVLTITPVTCERHGYKDGKKDYDELFKTLSFDISGDNYSFSFELNCKLEKLLEISMNETIDFNEYIFGGETWLNINGLNGAEPNMDIKITRYLKNKFIINIVFNTDYNNNDYSGVIEFDFNLDDFLYVDDSSKEK